MLRRKPTAIAITSEDIAAFEESLLRKNTESGAQQPAFGNGVGEGDLGKKVNPSDELKPLPGDKARILRREERIGLGSRG
ncbi:hypothetical protein POX_c04422 [Penicillium oxalicum]|uniref:hypothetical protein n=1 Tax=Penicillium oxalicum TaxID=69781 RepID=UPI0020B79A33|nr:hypothetical protein POX_c04422 [Penicillium oxalicum]KAI2791560.1 hypothetical protein POX_c04422 [Penicillium oxalicum]